MVVLGAGLAGLAAAFELDEAGCEVVVVEARERPGGRVETLRDGFSPGLYADAGAMAFSDSYRHLLHYAAKLALPVESLAERWAAVLAARAHYHLRGRHLVAGPDGAVDWPYELTAEERALGRWGILERYLVGAVAAGELPPELAALPDWARPLDALPLAELMRARGASEGAIELVRFAIWFGSGMHDVSAAACLLADVGLFLGEQTEYAFAGGLDRLPRAFAERLRGRIVYGVEAVKIAWRADGARITVRRGESQDTMEAERVVSALPFSVLRRMEVEPAFADEKSACIRELAYAPVTRVFLEVRRRFWEERGVTSWAYTDLPILRVMEQPVLPSAAAGERSLLEAHAGGDAALALDRLTPDARVELVLTEMERVHPGVRAAFEGAVTKSWAEDPYARGAYSLYGPGQLTRWLAVAQRPEGAVHFAGEHTSRLSATMEGALESGARAAREIVERG